MTTNNTDSNREKMFSSDSTKLDTHISTRSKPVLGTIMTLTCLFPMLFCSCRDSLIFFDNGTEKQSITDSVSLTITKGVEITCIKGLDIFTFDDDRLMRLDSYRSTYASGSERIGIHSRGGNKIVFICANSKTDRYGWSDITSFPSLDNHSADLTKEDPQALFMTGKCHVEAGKSELYEVDLRPLASEICLRSISCDFTGKSYAGSVLKNVSVYLTNVNSQCSITADGMVMPAQIVNNGRLNEDDVAGFEYPEIIFRRLKQSVGSRKITTDIRLLCYPNTADREGPGSPFTRLVIEGEIDGKTYWWPIEVNRDGNGEDEGIFRNRRYVYDIVIRRKGMTDPETPIATEDIDISIETTTWNEKESYPVVF